jgi:hypothetical protein
LELLISNAAERLRKRGKDRTPSLQNVTVDKDFEQRGSQPEEKRQR